MKNELANDYALISRIGERMTYQQLGQKIFQMYEMAQGSVSGRKLCVLVTDNSLECILLYLMCIRHKMPLLLLDERNVDHSIWDVLERFLPAFVWMPCQWNQIASAICKDGLYRVQQRENGYLWLYGEREEYFISSDLALLLSTSGSMGGVKYVCLSYQNLLDNTRNIVKALKIEKGERAAVMLPISYSYGLSVVNTYLYQGGTLLLGNAMIVEKNFWEFLRMENVNALCGVPYTYEIIEKIGVLQKKIKSLKKMTQAGGKLALERQRRFAELAIRDGFDFYVMYGQTEATARMSCFCLSQEMNKLGSVGKAIPGGKFSVVTDEDGRGEIIYYGDNIFLGYARNAKELKDLYSVKELYTGDIGYLDAEGYLYITGRKKRFVKMRGFRIELDEIQEKLSSETKIEVVCVKEQKTDRILVFSLEKICDGHRILSEICHQIVTKELADFVVLKEFPRCSNGKIAFGVLENWEGEHGYIGRAIH